ncbi:hypothetical protein G443_003905 [Actinoalloteichus cyanogriseus DSM 43889]|uniref:Sugar phosphate isomerase n=2 Tax=Actinoalloteichus cyanogriseus TaxID=2893586 RepID=A0ABT1JM83_ACTCY|nr:hypothetical protein [Actinoalloteichus caeruleus DSM 43889]
MTGQDQAETWLNEAVHRVTSGPTAVRSLFPAVGREVGRAALRPEEDPGGLVHGTVDDQARTLIVAALVAALEAEPEALARELRELYRYGDDAEKRGLLRGLAAVAGRAPDPADPVVAAGLLAVRDALRANDVRLVAAAMGPFAAAHLDDHSWRHGVLKCLFVEVPLAAVAELTRRTDPELLRMVADYAAERRAAGREVPADALALLATDEGRPPTSAADPGEGA